MLTTYTTSPLYRRIFVAAGLATTIALTSGPAFAGSPVAVSTFDQDRPERPGTTVTRALRVTNLGEQELSVRVSSRAVALLDDGATRMSDHEDPQWTGRITISPPSLTLAAKTSQDVGLSIAVPVETPPTITSWGLSSARWLQVGECLRSTRSEPSSR